MPTQNEEAERFARLYIARERYLVTRPGEPAFELFLCPPWTLKEVQDRYPHYGVLPL